MRGTLPAFPGCTRLRCSDCSCAHPAGSNTLRDPVCSFSIDTFPFLVILESWLDSQRFALLLWRLFEAILALVAQPGRATGSKQPRGRTFKSCSARKPRSSTRGRTPERRARCSSEHVPLPSTELVESRRPCGTVGGGVHVFGRGPPLRSCGKPGSSWLLSLRLRWVFLREA